MRTLLITLSIILLLATGPSAKIVFETSRGEKPGGIHVMNDDGSNIIQLTEEPFLDNTPRWSPDGKQIVFERVMSENGQQSNLFIINADGTNLRQLTETHPNRADTFPAFSPDGKRIVFSRVLQDKTAGIYVMKLDSGAIKKISDFLADHLDWSPEGRWIIFSNVNAGHNIWIINADGRNAKELLLPIPEEKRIFRGEPRWSPDGKRILYTEGEFKLVQIGPGKWKSVMLEARYIICDHNGDNPQRLGIPNNWKPSSIAWMNDGKTVLFSADADFDSNQPVDSPDRAYDIYKYHIVTGKITPLTTNPGNDVGADWVSGALSISPEGKRPTQWGQIKLYDNIKISRTLRDSFMSFMFISRQSEMENRGN